MANSLKSMNILHSLSELNKHKFGEISKEYELLEYDDVEGNVKRIGDRIVEKIQKEYIDNNPNNTPIKIKAQIKKDLLVIYYENASQRKVKQNIKEKICNAWYGALKARNAKIMKDIVLLLNKEDTSDYPVATLTALRSGGSKDVNPVETANMSEKYSGCEAGEILSNSGELCSKKFESSLALLGTNPDQTSSPQTDKNKKTEEEQNKQSTEYLDKLIEYKSKLFEVENFEQRPISRSATVSQIYELHEGIISKVLCNYAVIDRAFLVEELRKILIGERAIEELNEFNRSKKWIQSDNKDANSEREETPSIYTSFVQKLQSLGDIKKYSSKSNRIERNQPLDIPAKQSGGKTSTIIPEYIPTTYIWEDIRGHVETQLQIRIQNKLSLDGQIVDNIKNGFEEVFLQVNCDSLDLISDKSEIMTNMLNTEYHMMLDYLCKNIPDKYAAPILQSYILRNFTEFVQYLETVFFENANPLEAFLLGYRNMPSKMLNNTNIKPVYPEIKRESLPVNNKYDELDNCCNDRNGDKNLDAGGVSGFIKTENIGKEPSIVDRVTPSILLPAFNVFKTQFNECSENVDFLAVLFKMYSGKSVKFMQQIQQQFSHDGVNEFIERYILTKHPYTTKIISECIKHVSDIKLTLVKMAPKRVDEDGEPIPFDNNELVKNVSQYAAVLMHSGSILSPAIDTTVQNAYINYVQTQIALFPSLMQGITLLNIEERIIKKIPPQEVGSYNSALRKIFVVNNTVSNSIKRNTRKARNGMKLRRTPDTK